MRCVYTILILVSTEVTKGNISNSGDILHKKNFQFDSININPLVLEFCSPSILRI